MTRAEQHARELFASGSLVLHVGLAVTGRPVAVFSPGGYRDENDNPVDKPVMKLDTGHAFILRDDEEHLLVGITEQEAALHARLIDDLKTVIIGAVVEMSRSGGSPERQPVALALIQAALVAQLRALAASPS